MISKQEQTAAEIEGYTIAGLLIDAQLSDDPIAYRVCADRVASNRLVGEVVLQSFMQMLVLVLRHVGELGHAVDELADDDEDDDDEQLDADGYAAAFVHKFVAARQDSVAAQLAQVVTGT